MSIDSFPWKSSEACTNIVSKLEAEGNPDQVMLDMQAEEYINQAGLPLKYRPYLYEIEKAEEITGEHSAAGYAKPLDVVMVIEVKDSPHWLEYGGFKSDENVTAWLHITTFKRKVKAILDNEYDERREDYEKIYDSTYEENLNHTHSIEPKPGDVFQLTTYGSDRQWDRGDRMWIVTNVEDEILSENFNTVMGHYMWKITAKRFRFAHETGMSNLEEKMKDDTYLGEQGEKGNHQVYENLHAVAVNLIKNYKGEEEKERIEHPKVYDTEVDEDGKVVKEHSIDDASKDVYNMEVNVKDFYNPVQGDGWI